MSRRWTATQTVAANRSESEADGAQLGQVGQRSPLEHFEHLVLPFVST